MESTIEEGLKTIIEKNLPAHVGDVLQKRLQKADDDANMVDYLRREKIKSDDEITTLKAKVKTDEDLNDREHQLNQKEKELDKLSMKMELREAKYQLESEKDKTQFAKEVALGLVRNTSYRKTVFDGGHNDENGRWIADKHNSSNSSATDTAD